MLLYIEYRTVKLQKICNDFKKANCSWGDKIARKLFQRLSEIIAAECLAGLDYMPPTRCHPLDGNRKGQFAIDLIHPFRLIIKSVLETDCSLYGIDPSLIKKIKIMEVVDYHG